MNKLIDGMKELGITADEGLISYFSKLMNMILEWNEKVNLTSITDKDEFIEKHFLDSLSCYPHIQYKKSHEIVDVGTGAGFPGLPLALVSPDKHFLLIDSLNKRIKIITEMAEALNIKNVTAIHGRAEDFAHKPEYREQFDMCVSRAVSRLPVLSEYCLPFVALNGWFTAYKGSDSEQEINSGKGAIKILGGKIDVIEDSIINKYGMNHRLIYIKKIKSTPSSYPRKAGIPEKTPL